MVYSPHPPYEILQNKLLDFATMQRLRRFAKYWDLVAQQRQLRRDRSTIWSDGASPFNAVLKFSDWFYAKLRRQHSIPLATLAEMLFLYLTTERSSPAATNRRKYMARLATFRPHRTPSIPRRIHFRNPRTNFPIAPGSCATSSAFGMRGFRRLDQLRL